MRIVSLLPSATEIVCALGLEGQLVGVTHECDFPASVRKLPKVTRTLIPTEASSGEIDHLVRERLQKSRALYALDLPVIQALAPDLIVTQALCDVCAVAEDEVRAAAYTLPGTPQVINLEPQNLSQVLASMTQVATAAGADRSAEEAIARMTARVEAVVARTIGIQHRPRVVLLEWLQPHFPAAIGAPSWSAWRGASRDSAKKGSLLGHFNGVKCWPGSPMSFSSPAAASAWSGRCAICHCYSTSLGGRTCLQYAPIGCT